MGQVLETIMAKLASEEEEATDNTESQATDNTESQATDNTESQATEEDLDAYVKNLSDEQVEALFTQKTVNNELEKSAFYCGMQAMSAEDDEALIKIAKEHKKQYNEDLIKVAYDSSRERALDLAVDNYKNIVQEINKNGLDFSKFASEDVDYLNSLKEKELTEVIDTMIIKEASIKAEFEAGMEAMNELSETDHTEWIKTASEHEGMSSNELVNTIYNASLTKIANIAVHSTNQVLENLK